MYGVYMTKSVEIVTEKFKKALLLFIFYALKVSIIRILNLWWWNEILIILLFDIIYIYYVHF